MGLNRVNEVWGFFKRSSIEFEQISNNSVKTSEGSPQGFSQTARWIWVLNVGVNPMKGKCWSKPSKIRGSCRYLPPGLELTASILSSMT